MNPRGIRKRCGASSGLRSGLLHVAQQPFFFASRDRYGGNLSTERSPRMRGTANAGYARAGAALEPTPGRLIQMGDDPYRQGTVVKLLLVRLCRRAWRPRPSKRAAYPGGQRGA